MIKVAPANAGATFLSESGRLKPKQILITGGAGFIGSHLTSHLLEQGHYVVVVDDLSTGYRSNIFGMPADHLEFIEADVAEVLPQWHNRSPSFDEIYHLAATVGVSRVVDQPMQMMQNNLRATEAALALAMCCQSPILLASSSEVYGYSGEQGPLLEDQRLQIGPPDLPRWGYALTKALDEQMALSAFKASQLSSVVVRLFNTIGPRQVGEYGMVVPRMVQAALRSRPLQVYGDGRQTRAFCDVADVVTAMPMLLRKASCHGQVFNLGSDQPITIDALASLILRVTASKSIIERVPYSACPQRADEPRQRLPSIDKIRSAIGWSPCLDLEMSVKRVVDWMRFADKGS